VSADNLLRHPLLADLGVDHGFGLRGFEPPEGLRRPRQVHGVAVASAQQCAGPHPAPEADAIVSVEAGVRVAVVTADCLPILIAADRGRAVAAVHAGWRGLAAGVIGACAAVMREQSEGLKDWAAVIGPHIGSCCYEVDEPVLAAFEERFSETLPSASRHTRTGHAQLDLGLLARRALREAGIEGDRIASLEGVCTSCDAQRFDSYRREGAKAGRLVHFIAARSSSVKG
jgi:YfiH family protein